MNTDIFKFEHYNFNPKTNVASFNYCINRQQPGKNKHKTIKFTETLQFPKTKQKINKYRLNALDKALFNLFLIAGITYYKTYCPKKIELKSHKLSLKQAKFWNKLYTKGLGEFFYQNKINPKELIKFPHQKNYHPKNIKLNLNKILVPLGGGKDSVLTCEILKQNKFDFDLISLRKFNTTSKVAKTIDKKLFIINRKIDPKFFKINRKKNVYSGHIPFSAYTSFTALVFAILHGYKFIIYSNERSSNYGNTKYFGQQINHQYAKSFEFEQDITQYINTFITPNINYFSLLRPWYEIKITQKFSQYEKYFPQFSSCNLANFKFSGQQKNRWCCQCPKCVFVWTMLSAFLPLKQLIKIFKCNLYQNKKLEPIFQELLGQKKTKPFECVGTPEEMQLALYLASKKSDYQHNFIIKQFTKQLLPKIKNIKYLQKKLFKTYNQHNLPKKFQQIIK